MTDRERWDLRGPVRSCELERRWQVRRCGAGACEVEERFDSAALEFRPDGALARQSHHNPDGSEWTAVYEYDDAGRLRAIRAETVTSYEYDAAGRLARTIVRTPDSGERLAESYEYGAAGRKTKTVHVDLAAQRPDTLYSWSVEGTDSAYSAPGAATIQTHYNDRGQPAEMLFPDARGQPLSRVTFRCDADGRLREEEQTREPEALPAELAAGLNEAQLATVRRLFGAGPDPIRQTHSYDEQGRRCRTESHIGPLASNSKTLVYNDRGDPAAEVHESEHREFGMDEHGALSPVPRSEKSTRSEARFEYGYDARGNWLSKTVHSRSAPDAEFAPSTVEQRAILYFDTE